MNTDKTKNNHYVPRFYLKNFWNDYGNLFQLYIPKKRIETIQGEKGLSSICRGKNLYTVKNEISDRDISDFKMFFLQNYKVPDDYILLLKNYLNVTLGNLYEISKKNSEVYRY